MAKLEPYSKKLPYSYTLGVFPSLMLLEAHPERAMRLLVHSDGEKNEGVQKLRERCAALGVREEIADRVLKRESKKDNCFAGLVFEKYEIDPSPTECHAVLCQISDSGNAGTALRSLIGFGIHDVALVRPCVDVFDPHVLRASMGEVAAQAVKPYSLVFGNEASGLPTHFSSLGQSVFIPQSDEIDSLNLAVAVSVGAYTFLHGGKKQ